MRNPFYLPHKFLFFLFLFLIIWPNSSSDSSLLRFESKEGEVVPAELWCVAKNNADDGTLQAALDWACGLGGSNCQPIQTGGACFGSDDILLHASYAFNDYYLRHNVDPQACVFGGAATLTSIDPAKAKGIPNCRFPSSLSVRNGSMGLSMNGGGGQNGTEVSSGCGAVVGELRWTGPLMVLPLLMVVITTMTTCYKSSVSVSTWLS